MEPTAENQELEVVIEEHSSEQTPDDSDQQGAEEQPEGGASQPEDEGDSEQEFYFGDNKLDSPASEEGADKGLVKHLRKTIKEKDRKLQELQRQPQAPVEQQAPLTNPPRMPKLDDQDIDYNDEVYQQRMAKWAEDSGKYQEQDRARKQQEQQLQSAYQEKLVNYQQRAKALKITGYQEAEQTVMDEVPVHIQNTIILESEKPEMVVLALGRNPELRKQLAEATSPIAIGRLIERIESNQRQRSCQKLKAQQQLSLK